MVRTSTIGTLVPLWVWARMGAFPAVAEPSFTDKPGSLLTWLVEVLDGGSTRSAVLSQKGGVCWCFDRFLDGLSTLGFGSGLVEDV